MQKVFSKEKTEEVRKQTTTVPEFLLASRFRLDYLLGLLGLLLGPEV
jgi:hypothetical protein